MTQRQEIIERLNGLELEGGSHEMLSAICKAVLPHSGAWTLRRCWDLRDRLVRLLGEADTPHGGGRIDAEHEEALREAYTKGREDGMGMANAKDAQAEYLRGKNDGYDEGWDAGFASADDWCAQHEDAMAEHGWYRALDGDKATIRIGDKVDSDYHEDGIVMGIQFYEMPRGIRTLVAVRPDGWDVATWHMPDDYRHYAPTVEDTLREFYVYAERGKEHHREDVDDAVLAEYAAKLRLVGDAE